MDSSHATRRFWRSRYAFDLSACVSALEPFGGRPGPFLAGLVVAVMLHFSPNLGKLLQADVGMLQATAHNPLLSFPLESTASA